MNTTSDATYLAAKATIDQLCLEGYTVKEHPRTIATRLGFAPASLAKRQYNTLC